MQFKAHWTRCNCLRSAVYVSRWCMHVTDCEVRTDPDHYTLFCRSHQYMNWVIVSPPARHMCLYHVISSRENTNKPNTAKAYLCMVSLHTASIFQVLLFQVLSSIIVGLGLMQMSSYLDFFICCHFENISSYPISSPVPSDASESY